MASASGPRHASSASAYAFTSACARAPAAVRAGRRPANQANPAAARNASAAQPRPLVETHATDPVVVAAKDKAIAAAAR